MEATGALAFALWNKRYIKCVCVQCKFFCSKFIVEHLERTGKSFWLTVDAVVSVEFVGMLWWFAHSPSVAASLLAASEKGLFLIYL